MHIAIDARAIGPHFPGISRATLGLLSGLHESDHDAKISVVHRDGQCELLTGTGVAHDARFRLVKVDVGQMATRQQWRIPRLARALAPAVWHAPYYFRPFWGLPPTVVTIFDTIGPDDGRAGRGARPRLARVSRRLLWEAAMDLSVRSAAHIITSSQAAYGELQRRYRRQLPSVSVIPLAADDHFRPPSEQQLTHFRERAGIHEQYVLYVGSNKPHKNLASLVQAWARLVRDGLVGADLRLIIAGREDPRYTSARGLAGQLGLGASVRFMPDVPEADLPALLGGAECFVFPSFQEGFGLPPLEAMACGTPVVASNRGSLPEVIGDAGLLVEPKPESLAAAIRHILQDEELRARLRAQGITHAGQFSWKRTAAATLEVYKQLA